MDQYFLQLAEWLEIQYHSYSQSFVWPFLEGWEGFLWKVSGLYRQPPPPPISGSWHCYLLCVTCSSFFILGACLGFSLEKASPPIQGLCLYYLPNAYFLQPCFLYYLSLKLLFCRFWVLIWSANFFFQFFGLLICFLGEIFPPLFFQPFHCLLCSNCFTLLCLFSGVCTIYFGLSHLRACGRDLWLSFIYMCVGPTTQSCLTLCDPMDRSLLGSSAHRIFQARILEWVAISSSRGSSWPRDQTCVSSLCM